MVNFRFTLISSSEVPANERVLWKAVDGKFDNITQTGLGELDSDKESDESESDRLSEDDQVTMAEEAATSANKSNVA